MNEAEKDNQNEKEKRRILQTNDRRRSEKPLRKNQR